MVINVQRSTLYIVGYGSVYPILCGGHDTQYSEELKLYLKYANTHISVSVLQVSLTAISVIAR